MPAVTPVRLSSTGLVAFEPRSLPQHLLGFLDAVLRGIGQVMLQNNRYTGLFFLAGVFYSSWLFGWAVLAGAAVATAVAMLIGANRVQVREGLFGFNGALAAVAVLYFIEPGILSWGYALLTAACTSVVMAVLPRFLSRWSLPALTAPFVFITLCFVMACVRFGYLQPTGMLPPAGLPVAVVATGTVTASTFAEGVLAGVAQVFFQSSPVTGILFAAGLLASSRAACAAALLGSLAGLLAAWGLGASEPAIRAGVFGFNPALTAIALGSGVFSGAFNGLFARRAASAAYTALAVMATIAVSGALSAVLGPLGIPALTLPFVLVTWLFLLLQPIFQRLRMQPEN